MLLFKIKFAIFLEKCDFLKIILGIFLDIEKCCEAQNTIRCSPCWYLKGSKGDLKKNIFWLFWVKNVKFEQNSQTYKNGPVTL